MPTIAHRSHQHVGCGRHPGFHPVLVLVPAGPLPGPGFHADLSDRPEHPVEGKRKMDFDLQTLLKLFLVADAEARVEIQREAQLVRLSCPAGREET